MSECPVAKHSDPYCPPCNARQLPLSDTCLRGRCTNRPESGKYICKSCRLLYETRKQRASQEQPPLAEPEKEIA
jgi:hypothetical protein